MFDDVLRSLDTVHERVGRTDGHRTTAKTALKLSVTRWMNTVKLNQFMIDRAGFTQLEAPVQWIGGGPGAAGSRHTGSCIAWPLIAMANHLEHKHRASDSPVFYISKTK